MLVQAEFAFTLGKESNYFDYNNFEHAWLYNFYWAEVLRKHVVEDSTSSTLLSARPVCGWSTLFCNETGNDYLKCIKKPCVFAKLRKDIWANKTTLPLHALLSIDPDTFEPPCSYPRPYLSDAHLPEEIFDKLSAWPFAQRPTIEYANTVLFAIYALTRNNLGTFDSAVMSHIEALWERILGKEATGEYTLGEAALPRLVSRYLHQWEHDGQLFQRPEWLISWFFLRMLDSRAFARHRDDSHYSPDERLLFHKRMATLGMYSLFWMRVFGETRGATFSDVKSGYRGMLEALIHMLCEYAHVDGELPRSANLSSIMGRMWSQQAAHYTMAEMYRDHLHHVIEVCLMGLFFMRMKKGNNSPLLRDLTLDPDIPKIIRNWIVASLLHDVGYSIKLLSYPLEQLAGYQDPASQEFSKKMKNAYKDLKKLLGPILGEEIGAIIGWKPDMEDDIDHGVLSASVIARHLDQDKAKASRDAWTSDMRPAIEAAALHNLKSMDIEPRKHPLGFLLFLCDNLQEWDRPMIKGEMLRHSLLVHLVNQPTSPTHKNRPFVEYLVVSAKASGTEYELVGDTLDLQLLFGPADALKFYPPLTWVTHTQQMQRLKDTPLPIRLTLCHPCRKTNRGSAGAKAVSHYDMDCFQTFLRSFRSPEMARRSDPDASDNAALRQWAVSLRSGITWARYKKCTQFESVEFELHNGKGKKLLGSLPDCYISNYIWWINDYRDTRLLEEISLI